VQQRRTAGPGSRGVRGVPAWLSGLARPRHTWLAAYLLAAACGDSSSPPEPVGPEPVGQIRVTSSTTGSSVDPDGYTVALDEGAGQPLQVNGTLLLEDVEPGDHMLTLAGVASNCRIEGQQPVTVVVAAGETTEASFTVTCSAAALAFRLVSSGRAHTCGVTTEDKVYCWGANTEGQLGSGTWNGPEQCEDSSGEMWGCSWPVAVLSELRFLSVSAGDFFTCGVTTDNHAYCWGSNSEGKLGDGTTSSRLTPVPVAGGLSFRQVSAGLSHTCGVTTDNRAYCWGRNDLGQLGDGTQVDHRLTPVRVAGTLRFRQVSAAGSHTCGITTDSLAFCWGSNPSGQLGDSTLGTLRLLPVPVVGGHHFRQIDAGEYHTCAVTPESRAFCWGQAVYGQLGNGGTWPPLPTWPQAVAGGLSFDRVMAGTWHTCGVSTDQFAYCWGSNEYGKLGNGTTTGPEVCDLGPGMLGGQFVCSTVPVTVVGGHSFTQVDVGVSHTCARTEANVAYCWGATSSGLLGNGETDSGLSRATPTPVLGPL
jgi:alpha-tubulin suppressor-like RCC1 family protein